MDMRICPECGSEYDAFLGPCPFPIPSTGKICRTTSLPRRDRGRKDKEMVVNSVIQKVDSKRLQKAVEGLVSGAYKVTVTQLSEGEIRGIVRNREGVEYGITLTEGESFCSCRDCLYRETTCKHQVILALHVIRHPQERP